MSRRNLIAVLPAALLSAVAPGCGGGSEQVTATELAQKGDAICRTEQTRFSQIQALPPVNASVAADQTKQLVDAAESAGSDLRDLEPPENLRPTYDRYLEARDRATDEIKKGQDAAENRDSRAYGAAQSAVASSAPERQKLAGSLGFKVCSQSTATGAP